MADPATARNPIALARSPIPVALPEIERAGWVVSGRRSDAALTIADWTPLAKLLVRSDRGPSDSRSAEVDTDSGSELTPASVHDVRYGAAAPRTSNGVGVLLVGWAPGEWLALGPPGTRAALADRLADTTGALVDMTHAYALLRLTGDAAPNVLAHECAIDLSDSAAPNGSVFRTAVSGVAAGVVRDDRADERSYLVHCESSAGHYLFESLFNTGHDDGIDVDGLRITQSNWAIRNSREH
jgi:heterotetrameric sarcosine oxidase gamma subunit